MTDNSLNLKPQHFFNCLTEITADDFTKMGVKLIAVDLDNTSVFDCTMTPVKGAKAWFKKIKEAGFKVVLISNSFELRGHIMGKVFGCNSYGPAAKPDTKMMAKAAEEAGVKPCEMALVGDRLFTDIAGANKFGAVSVYVRPYRKEFMIPRYWKKARQDEIDYLKTINISRDLKTIYYK
ncbi:MAG: HAD-IA family hydrolase [Clostridia bacterium]|nr:HAD-IA family hydrolase [Clostridia bacterium]